MKPISRKAAKAKGRKWYFTGKPCPHGHVTRRWVSSSGCIGCVKAYRCTPRGRKSLCDAYKRYNSSPLGFERNVRSRNSPAGIEGAYRRRTKNPLTIECRRRNDRNRRDKPARKTWTKKYRSSPKYLAYRRRKYAVSVGRIDTIPT